jgi:hypothetical protein
LTELSRLDSEQGRIVELRFFGGFSIEETAEVLGISSATVKRHWMTARIWLFSSSTERLAHDTGALADGSWDSAECDGNAPG